MDRREESSFFYLDINTEGRNDNIFFLLPSKRNLWNLASWGEVAEYGNAEIEAAEILLHFEIRISNFRVAESAPLKQEINLQLVRRFVGP